MSRFGTRLDENFAVGLFGETLAEVTGWIAENLVPEDVFTDSQLEEWAEENGFTRIN